MNPQAYIQGSPHRALWDSLPNGEFLQINNLSSFDLKFDTVLIKVRDSVPSLDLKEDKIADLPFGVAHAVTCANLVVAYQITVPKCYNINVSVNFAAFARKQHVSVDYKTYFVDRKIAIMGNSDGLLAISERLHWTLR